jgi:hypothetical protein
VKEVERKICSKAKLSLPENTQDQITQIGFVDFSKFSPFHDPRSDRDPPREIEGMLNACPEILQEKVPPSHKAKSGEKGKAFTGVRRARRAMRTPLAWLPKFGAGTTAPSAGPKA